MKKNSDVPDTPVKAPTADPATKAKQDAFDQWWHTQTQFDKNDMLAYGQQRGLSVYGMDPFADYSPHSLLDTLGKVADPIMNVALQATPYILAAGLGSAAAGALSAAGASSALGSSSGLGSAAATDTGLASGLGGTAATTGAATGLGDLAAGIPTVTITGSTAGAGTGLGSILGAGAAGAGAVGLGNVLNNPAPTPSTPSQAPNDPTDIPTVTVTGTKAAGGGLGSVLGAGAVGAGVGSILAGGGGTPASNPPPSNVDNGQLTGGDGLPGSGPGTTTGGITGGTVGSGIGNVLGGGVPGIGDILGGIGSVVGGITDYNKNTADQGYWQNYMDQLTGMYKPGTPEANLMQQQMDAKDAAAGRNSQYGVRATNLNAMLAQQRANIMTSPAFYQMGAASRGHYDNSLNGLFGALGQASTGGSNLGNLLNLGGSYLGNLFSNNTTNPPAR